MTSSLLSLLLQKFGAPAEGDGADKGGGGGREAPGICHGQTPTRCTGGHQR